MAELSAPNRNRRVPYYACHEIEILFAAHRVTQRLWIGFPIFRTPLAVTFVREWCLIFRPVRLTFICTSFARADLSVSVKTGCYYDVEFPRGSKERFCPSKSSQWRNRRPELNIPGKQYHGRLGELERVESLCSRLTRGNILLSMLKRAISNGKEWNNITRKKKSEQSPSVFTGYAVVNGILEINPMTNGLSIIGYKGGKTFEEKRYGQIYAPFSQHAKYFIRPYNFRVLKIV